MKLQQRKFRLAATHSLNRNRFQAAAALSGLIACGIFARLFHVPPGRMRIAAVSL